MLAGAITRSGSPVVPIEILGVAYLATIDTGFEGGLQLPDSFKSFCDQTIVSQQSYELPDGREIVRNLYEVQVVLDDYLVDSKTQFEESDQILMGTDALEDYRLEVNFVAGTVVLERATS